MNHEPYLKAVRNIFGIGGSYRPADNYLLIEKAGELVEPTEQEQALITAEVTRLQAEYDSQLYARNRKAEYDQLNQWEMHFDDQRDGTTTWVDKINEIKGRHPK